MVEVPLSLLLMLAAADVPSSLRTEQTEVRDIVVKVVDSTSAPLREVAVEMCPLQGVDCYPAVLTDAAGVAKFREVPHTRVEFRVQDTDCGPHRETLDLKQPDSSDPLRIVVPATATLNIRVREQAASGGFRPVFFKYVQTKLHPRPVQPHGVGVSWRASGSDEPTDRFKLCVRANVEYDVEVTIEGFCLASSRESGIPPHQVRTITHTLRRKPEP